MVASKHHLIFTGSQKPSTFSLATFTCGTKNLWYNVGKTIIDHQQKSPFVYRPFPNEWFILVFYGINLFHVLTSTSDSSDHPKDSTGHLGLSIKWPQAFVSRFQSFHREKKPRILGSTVTCTIIRSFFTIFEAQITCPTYPLPFLDAQLITFSSPCFWYHLIPSCILPRASHASHVL